ncbi:MAG: hypothetical protein WB611_19995 [Stellaceae bacterium]
MKTALDLALEAWHELEAEREEPDEAQGDLFAAPSRSLPKVAERNRGPGRPSGARNKRTDQLSRWFIAKHGGRDPLEFMISIGGLPVLSPGVLDGLAKLLGGVTKLDAMKIWISVNSTLLPFIHQRQASIEVRPPGAPGSGQPVFWSVTEDSEIVDITPPPADEAAE